MVAKHIGSVNRDGVDAVIRVVVLVYVVDDSFERYWAARWRIGGE